jgi:hypothetical protein
MNVAHPVAYKIVARVKAMKGKPVSASDLLALGARAAIDQALSRLFRHGTIRRVGRGLYMWPLINKLLNQPMTASVDSMAKAWARKNGLRIIPFGAHAANLLGLSTQVPAKIVYYTNGRTQTIKLGAFPVRFLNRGPRTMDVSGRLAPHVFQAVRWMGRHGMTPQNIGHLQTILKPRDKSDLIRNLWYASAWMKPILKQISEGGDI